MLAEGRFELRAFVVREEAVREALLRAVLRVAVFALLPTARVAFFVARFLDVALLVAPFLSVDFLVAPRFALALRVAIFPVDFARLLGAEGRFLPVALPAARADRAEGERVGRAAGLCCMTPVAVMRAQRP